MFKKVFLFIILMAILAGTLWYRCSKPDAVELEPVKTTPEPTVVIAPPPEPATVPTTPAPEPVVTEPAVVPEPQEVAAFQVFYDVAGKDCTRKLFMWGEDTSLETLAVFFRWEAQKYSDDVNVTVYVFDKALPEDMMNDVFQNDAVDKYPEYADAFKATVDFGCSDEQITTYIELEGKDVDITSVIKEQNAVPCKELRKYKCDD